jgi:hypothetical protein
MTLEDIRAAARTEKLAILGAFHPLKEHKAPDGTGTLILLGPDEPGYWGHIQSSPEWRDRNADPIDRWSTRVISKLAQTFSGQAFFPFGGPPFEPFFTWALASGQAWQSPVSILVHAQAGLMVSYRGAIALQDKLELPQPDAKPCDTCAKPCLTACKPRALTGDGYDVPACHAYLDTTDGAQNLRQGCNVRRSCPLSQSYGRLAEHSAYHMSIFHK